MKKTNMQQILEFLMPKLAERMDKIYPTDKEYKKSVNKEEKLYDTLRKELSKEHLQIFDEYVHTTIDTTNAVGGSVKKFVSLVKNGSFLVRIKI